MVAAVAFYILVLLILSSAQGMTREIKIQLVLDLEDLQKITIS